MAIASQSMDQSYGLRGLNMITPDQTIDDSDKTRGQSPWTINSRILAPQTDSDPRTAISSRRGVAQYTIPVGESIDANYTTTNLVVNPSFEVSTASWNGIRADLVKTSAQAVKGTSSLQATVNSVVGNSAATRTFSGLTIGQTYTLSAYVKANLNDLVYIYCDELTASYVEITQASGDWQRLSVTGVCSATSGTIEIGVGSATVIIGDIFYVDGVMLEHSATLNPYTDEDLGDADQPISYLNMAAQRFTPTQDKALTAIDLALKTNTSNDTIVVKVYENVAGNFGTLVGTSSIAQALIDDTYSYVKCRFLEAPTLDTAKQYWIVVSGLESSVTNTYHLAHDASGANGMSSVDGGENWTVGTGGFKYKTYLSDTGGVKGHHRFVTKGGIKQTLFAHGTSIYRVTNESTGATVAIKTGLSAAAERVRFVTVYDKVFIVNGIDNMGKWDGTTYTESTHTVDFPVPDNVVIYHDRAWFYSRSEPTKLYFSAIYPDLEVVSSVNFQYVPDTASADPITGFVVFQDQLVIFTKESKYLLLGDDVSTLGLAQSPGGTKGAVSQEAISMGEKVVYFWSIDGGGYYYDGAQDIAISDPIQPEGDSIADLDQIDAIVVGKQWRVYYRKSGSTVHNRMLLYDLRYGEWLLDTETYTRLPVAWSLETNVLYEASSTCGALYFAEAAHSQLGSPILFRYWTNYKKYSSGIAKDRIRTFRAIFASPDRTIDVRIGKDADFDNDARYKNVVLASSGILYDGGETYDSPTALYGKGSRVSQPKVSLSGRAMNTQYRFEKDVVGTEVALYGYEAIVKSARPR